MGASARRFALFFGSRHLSGDPFEAAERPDNISIHDRGGHRSYAPYDMQPARISGAYPHVLYRPRNVDEISNLVILDLIYVQDRVGSAMRPIYEISCWNEFFFQP